MFDNDTQIDLSGNASRSTMGTAAAWLGWALLLGLAIVTAVHAISITQHYTGLNATGGDAFAMIRIVGVVLAELFAVVTAVLLATHTLRAKQKPMAMAVEITWFFFAAINLISSFAVEHGGEMPQFVGTWVRYGLPVAALIIGVQFYIMLRLNPDAKRADDDAEMLEQFSGQMHKAKLEVLASDQMRAVLRQAQWQKLPSIVGRQLNLSDAQIAALERQAPALLDLNRNGVPDVQETQPARANDPRYGYVSIPELREMIDLGHVPSPVARPAPPEAHPNGRAGDNGHH
jgi:hypothetical protein